MPLMIIRLRVMMRTIDLYFVSFTSVELLISLTSPSLLSVELKLVICPVHNSHLLHVYQIHFTVV